MNDDTLAADPGRFVVETKVEGSCSRCGKDVGPLKLYRDPFGKAYAPGRWPTLTMHSDCFLAYIGERKAARLSSSGR